ncbi:hypothetical protein GQ53DRAFT_754976 [Thozetella sp. PMI_491]|nr:hypothetical protein GQ53DRAFT_754976 [Thozetella sp. PMI_491]
MAKERFHPALPGSLPRYVANPSRPEAINRHPPTAIFWPSSSCFHTLLLLHRQENHLLANRPWTGLARRCIEKASSTVVPIWPHPLASRRKAELDGQGRRQNSEPPNWADRPAEMRPPGLRPGLQLGAQCTTLLSTGRWSIGCRSALCPATPLSPGDRVTSKAG